MTLLKWPFDLKTLAGDQTQKKPRLRWQLSRRHQWPLALLALAAFGCVVAIVTFTWFSQPQVDIDKAAVSPIPQLLININLAHAGEIMNIPNVGPKLAQSIVEHRELNGPFDTPDQLLDVHGLGEKTLAKMEPFLLPLKSD